MQSISGSDKVWVVIIVASVIVLAVGSWYEFLRPMPSTDGVSVTQLKSKSEVTEDEIFVLVNLERVKAGLKPLKKNEKLTLAAYTKAKDMLDKDYWAHDSPNGWKPWDFIDATGYSHGIAGENLARGYKFDEDVVDAWMKSEFHRNNILNESFDATGVAIVDDKDSNRVLVVQMFGESK